ncbi:helix-turn-helix transcriptional regulator [Streptosporangium sp. NPDC051022]|uniref:helix-turn-helix domain-containing protein n=1 Tax=Streptosporangium sp. NPDC051022 TaxID=3155752 RepID=UPI0034264D26
MSEQREPQPKRQRLAAELRRLRDLSGLSGRELAQRIGISQSKVSRIESGTALPSLPEVGAWAEAVAAPAQTRELLQILTEAAFTESHVWRTRLAEHSHLQDDVRERESRVHTMLGFESVVIPGLLQTADYARQLFPILGVPYSPDAVAAAVAARLERQVCLYGDKRFDFLIAEAALHWRHGSPQTLLAQLDRIASLSTLDNVSIGLIPYCHQALAFVPHGFVIYEGDNEADTFITVETLHTELLVSDPRDIRLYYDQRSLLSRSALYGDQARDLLTEISATVRAQTR